MEKIRMSAFLVIALASVLVSVVASDSFTAVKNSIFWNHKN
jgi:hypothetical protein